jgi:hypothetical protein
MNSERMAHSQHLLSRRHLSLPIYVMVIRHLDSRSTVFDAIDFHLFDVHSEHVVGQHSDSKYLDTSDRDSYTRTHNLLLPS